ncbi:MAG: G-D-S-L family lipolytic protein [Leptolyngbya sp. SIO4C1]|nr:G-D-S-L family lipolytic protein [Leptolyngbya sp. SIO4C1]
MVVSSAAPYSSKLSLKAYPKKVVVIGDSLVYGFGDVEGGGWVERLRRQWMDPDSAGPILYNLGVRGDGVQQVKHRLDSEFRLRGELRRRVPDLLVLSVGLNDAARLSQPRGRLMLDESTFSTQMQALLDQAQSLCPVFFVGMVPVNEAQMPYAEVLHFSRADQKRYRTITQRACAARGIAYLDIYERWLAQGDDWCNARLCRDGLHPNVLGYQTLTQTVLAWSPLMSALS